MPNGISAPQVITMPTDYVTDIDGKYRPAGVDPVLYAQRHSGGCQGGPNEFRSADGRAADFTVSCQRQQMCLDATLRTPRRMSATTPCSRTCPPTASPHSGNKAMSTTPASAWPAMKSHGSKPTCSPVRSANQSHTTATPHFCLRMETGTADDYETEAKRTGQQRAP